MAAWPDAGPGGPEGPAAPALAELLARRAGAAWIEDRAALPLAEVLGRHLAYPVCRDELGFASKAEYDLAVLRLLDDPDLLVPEDPALTEAVQDELVSAEPSLRVLASLEEVGLRPGPGLRRRQRARAKGPGPSEAGEAREVDPAPGRRPPRVAGPSVASPDAWPEPVEVPVPRVFAFGEEEGGEDGGGEGGGPAACGACGRELPGRDGVRFCPWCGEAHGEPRCGACYGPLEAGWRFCPTCGEATDRPRTGTPPPKRDATDREGGPDAVR